MEQNYVVYHLHDDKGSLLDSCTKWEDYVDLAASYGMKAIAEPWKNEDGDRVNTGVDILNGKASIFLSDQRVEIAHVHAQED